MHEKTRNACEKDGHENERILLSSASFSEERLELKAVLTTCLCSVFLTRGFLHLLFQHSHRHRLRDLLPLPLLIFHYLSLIVLRINLIIL